ncbi:UNVERIFIED_CONTAM: hypothetical protein HDU68_007752 [Siphonaria sp. JEL0065]|nr:hypothetical protein HDU68_007752 [Siphonaria sp. JEL0065]
MELDSLKSQDTHVTVSGVVNANSLAKSFMDRWMNKSKGSFALSKSRSSSYFFDSIELRNGLVNRENKSTSSTSQYNSVKTKTRSLPVLSPPITPEVSANSILKNSLVFAEPDSPTTFPVNESSSNSNNSLINGLVYNEGAQAQISQGNRGLINGLVCPE